MSGLPYGLGAPYIDVDEPRDSPLPHRYVHGGFADSDTRFSFYFPPKEQYQGRLYQYLEGGTGGHETVLAAGGIFGPDDTFRLVFEELGGYLVESNQGHAPNDGTGTGSDLVMFGASAESARYSKELAAEMYGAAPHHSYVYGGSGGGIRSLAAIEGAPDAWDGAVPSIASISTVIQGWSAIGLWWLHARHQRDDIVDAMAPGGSGNPFATLNAHARDALASVYRLGYPRGGEAFLWSAIVWLFSFVNPTEYDELFWTTPGFIGHDDPEHMATLLVHQKATVGAVLTPSELPPGSILGRMAATIPSEQHRSYAIRLQEAFDDPTQLFGSRIRVLSGAAAGRELYVNSQDEGVISVVGEVTPELFDGVEPGDEIEIDNRKLVSWAYSHRHHVDFDAITVKDPATGEPTFVPEFAGVRETVVDGRPIHPQMPRTEGTMSGYHTGKFAGKMIFVNHTADSMMWPVGAGTYHRRAREQLGDAIDDQFRLWWVEHGTHGPAEFMGPAMTDDKEPGHWRAQYAHGDGVQQQAMRDITTWVEDGVAPPPSTNYRFSADSGLVLADGAARGGIQPVVALTVNGGDRIDVAAGTTVSFDGVVDVPSGTGGIVWVEWDFNGVGTPDEHVAHPGTSEHETVTAEHRYDTPGTYFAGLRAGAHRQGAEGAGAASEHLARVRVVVS